MQSDSNKVMLCNVMYVMRLHEVIHFRLKCCESFKDSLLVKLIDNWPLIIKIVVFLMFLHSQE